MRAKLKACRAAAPGFCVLLTVDAPASAQPPAAPVRHVITGGTFHGFIEAADLALSLADDATKIVPDVGELAGRN